MLPNPFDCLWKLLGMGLERGGGSYLHAEMSWANFGSFPPAPNPASRSQSPPRGGEGPLRAFAASSGHGTKKLYFRKRDNRYECEMTSFFSLFFF